MLRIALTGGIGSGKSTVAQAFAALGVPVIDADALARELVQPGQAALEEIVGVFGPSVLHQDASLDRTALRQLVFTDVEQRARLEAILHPRIYREMERRVAITRGPYVILVIPLLIETGRRDIADRILAVDLPEDLQRERVMRRDDVSAELASAIMRSQCTREQRLAMADDQIVNDGSRADLSARVLEKHRFYLDLSGGATP
jgi:dephospho-CoA kinase